MSHRPSAFHLPNPMCLVLSGRDSSAVVNNLCTNDISRLTAGESCEAFLTNLRGWVVAHVLVYRAREDRVILAGQHPQPHLVREHIDRYIIREDARFVDSTLEVGCYLTTERFALPESVAILPGVPVAIGRGGRFWVYQPHEQSAIENALQSEGLSLGEADQLELLRIRSFWPEAEREITEKTLPQELDRDAKAISFNKGCYLGQETIARLDALGQLQKKLCLLRIDGDSRLEPGAKLQLDGKEVGELTSISAAEHCSFALGFVRRGAFQAGTQLTCESHQAVVLPSYSV